MQKNNLAMMLASSVLVCSAANATSSFDGFYGGAILNAHTATATDFRDASNELFTHSSGTNYAPSLFAGFGAAIVNNLYLGVEVNFTPKGAKLDSTEHRLNGDLAKTSYKVETTKTLGLKAGYIFSENLMVSAKYKRGNSDGSVVSTLCSGGNCVANGSGSGNGDIQTLALGIDYKLTNSIFATAEIGKTTPIVSSRMNEEFYNLGAGLGYRF